MDTKKVEKHWREEAQEALQVAWHLFEAKDFSYSLFFGHLAVEKLLKGIYVSRKGEHAPYIHNLQRLAEIVGIKLTVIQRDSLIKITAFNLESRYPDEKRTFKKKCTKKFTLRELNEIEDILKWLKSIK